MALCEVGFQDDSSSNLSVCVGFLYTVVRSCCRGLPNIIENKFFILFDFFGKLGVSVQFVKVVVKSVNFVFVNGSTGVVNVAYPERHCLSASCKGAFLRVLHNNLLRQQQKQATPWLFHVTVCIVFTVVLKVSRCKTKVRN